MTAQRKTIRDLFRLPPEVRAELIDGVIQMAPTPTPQHQVVSFRLAQHIDRYAQRCGGRMFEAPLDVVLPSRDVVEPDIFYFRKPFRRLPTLLRATPDLVVEVISPGTRRHDRVLKLNLYERNRVREYWIVDPIGKTVEIYFLRKGRFSCVAALDRSDRLISPGFRGLAFSLRGVFEGS